MKKKVHIEKLQKKKTTERRIYVCYFSKRMEANF